ncbi:MAG: alpha/beta fold hydrolase [Pyrinomonadaceae bacterium]
MQKKYIAFGLGGIIGAAVAWKFLRRPSTVYFEEYADLISNSQYSKFVDIDGLELHYQEFGKEADPTIILIHGYTASTYVWRDVAPIFAAAGFRVIAVDLIGYGYSEKPKWFDYTIASQARIIGRLMNRLGIGNATLIGSSYGGAVAAWYALDNPERVEKLVLVDAVTNDDPKKMAILRLANLPGVGELLTPFMADSKTFMKIRMKGTFDSNNRHLVTDDRVESSIRPLRAADGHNSILTTSRNWHAARIENDAYLIEQPTLLIWGENDKVIPLSNGERLYDDMLNSRLVIFKNCGHLPPEELPRLFTEVVIEFLNEPTGKIAAKDESELKLKQV